MTCETLLYEPHGRYLLLPSSFHGTIASTSNGASCPSPPISFPFVLAIYSAHPVVIKRRPAFLPALTIAKQIATMRGDAKPLGEVSKGQSTRE